jgi:hypothetical protein
MCGAVVTPSAGMGDIIALAWHISTPTTRKTPKTNRGAARARNWRKGLLLNAFAVFLASFARPFHATRIRRMATAFSFVAKTRRFFFCRVS